jgi:hypothetical protein
VDRVFDVRFDPAPSPVTNASTEHTSAVGVSRTDLLTGGIKQKMVKRLNLRFKVCYCTDPCRQLSRAFDGFSRKTIRHNK